MKSGGLLVLIAALGVSAGAAVGAGLPPMPTLPTITVPTVTVPTLPFPPVPTETTPTAPTPTVPTPVPLPSLHAGGSSGSAGPSGTASSPTGATQARVARLRASRPWLAANGRHRATTLTFRLAHPSRVIFTVVEVSPVCRVAGSFMVHGRAGVNRVRFAGRIHGRRLPAGTYRISARTRVGRAQRVTLVIVSAGVPSRSELAAASRRNVCAAHGVLAATAAGPSSSGNAKPSEIVRNQNLGSGTRGRAVPKTHTNALSPREIAKHLTNPLVIAALALAVLLLGLAAVPQRAVPDPRVTDLLARHRLEVAAAGIAALGAGLIGLALG